MHARGVTDLDLRTLHGSADGAMWFRSSGNLTRFLNGQAQTVAREPADPSRPQNLASDGHHLWLITGAGALEQIELKTLVRRKVLQESTGLFSLLARRNQHLIAGCGEGLCQYANGQWTRLPGVPPGRYVTLHEGRDGSLYARSARRVIRQAPGQSAFTDLSAGLPSAHPVDQPGLALTTDFHRRVLINTETGVARFENGRWNPVGDADGLAQQVVRDVFVDREGAIWIGTHNGLWRWLGDGAWRLFGAADGLPRRGVEFAAQARDGSLWLTGGTAGIFRGQAGPSGDWHFRPMPGLPAAWALLTVWRDGSVWFGAQDGGIWRHDPATGATALVAGADPQAYVHDFSLDRQGRVLAVTSRGLFRERSPAVLERILPGELFSLGFAPDGSLWAGGAGLVVRVDGARVETLATADGLEKNGIRAIQPDADGRIWMGTWKLDGLKAYRREGNRLTPVPVEMGTPEKVSAFFLRRDAANRMWAGTVRGLAALEEGRWHVYGRSQGLLGDQCTNASFLSDGRAWFATSGGLALYTPPLDRAPAQPPLTVIERVADRFAELPLGSEPRVSASAADFTIHFSVLSTDLATPPAVRYRMNDAPWRSASRGSLQFLNLSPGDYRLELAAQGRDGSWHPQPAVLALHVAPFWWQSLWFRSLLLGGLGLAGWRFLQTFTRRGTRREQQQNQARLRAMFDRYPGVVFLLDPAGRFAMANQRLEHYVGAAPGSLAGRRPKDVLTPASAAHFEERFAEVMHSGAPVEYQGSFEVSGERVLFDVRAFPLRNTEGQVEAVCAFATDVTDRARLERERDDANQRYQSFISRTSEGIFRVEVNPPIPVTLPARQFGNQFYRNAIIAEVNAAAARQLGVPVEQLIGTRYGQWRDRWHPENLATDRMWFEQGFTVNDMLGVTRGADGRERYCLANTTGIVEDGHLVRVWSTLRDITEQRQLQNLISGMARGVSAETGARFFDRLVEHLAGTLGARQAFVCEDGQTLACWSGGRLEPGLAFDPDAYPGETCLVTPVTGTNGEQYGQLAVVFDEQRLDRKPIGEALGIFATRAAAELERLRAERDILVYQERLRALAARNQRLAEEQRAHLAREIHDELGQQLTAIKIGLSFLRNHVKHDPRAREDVAELSALADETVRSVRRLATELRPPALDQLGLAAAIRAHANDARARYSLDIVCDLDDVRPAPETATAAFRVFQESLTNVARHSGASSATVELRAEAGRLVLTVRDNGRGLPEASSGTGSLGLLGMRERAAAVGGTLVIDSAPGAGTSVTALLPLPASTADATMEGTPS